MTKKKTKRIKASDIHIEEDVMTPAWTQDSLTSVKLGRVSSRPNRLDMWECQGVVERARRFIKKIRGRERGPKFRLIARSMRV